MQSTVKKYLNHSTTIHRQTRSRGTVTETTTSATGYVAEQTIAARDEAGVHLQSRTVVVYGPDVDVEEGDRIEIDSKTFTVDYIRKPKFAHMSTLNHQEVVLV